MSIKTLCNKALLLASLVIMASPSFAQIANGRYVIINQLSGKAMDVSNRSQDDGGRPAPSR